MPYRDQEYEKILRFWLAGVDDNWYGPLMHEFGWTKSRAKRAVRRALGYYGLLIPGVPFPDVRSQLRKGPLPIHELV